MKKRSFLQKLLVQNTANDCSCQLASEYFCTFVVLKKSIAILFLSIYLLTTTDAYQLLKMPMIFKHFVEHRQADKNISFLKFLDMHYMHGSPKDKDYHKDMQLPFKSSGDFISVLASEFIPLNEHILLTAPVVLVSEKKIAIQQNDLLPSYLASIWQPPKSC